MVKNRTLSMIGFFIDSLLKKGFRAKFVLQNSTYHLGIQRLLYTASPLIFHRNVSWYCCEYHEINTINLSLFILNHAPSQHARGIRLGNR